MSIVKFEVGIPVDGDGYIEMECDFCKNRFMLPSDTFQDDEHLHFFCPICGLPNKTNTFYCPEVLEKFEQIAMNYMYAPVVEGKPHLFMFDKAFTDVFMHSTGLDYLIWMTPYKHIDFLGKEMVLPTACAYKIGEKLPELIEYDTSKIVSTER